MINLLGSVFNSSDINIISVILNAIFTGIIALFGWLALKRKGWAFIVGMILFSLDSVLTLLFEDWISLGFHVFALICIFNGYNALRKIRQAEVVEPQPQIYNNEGEIT